MAHNTKMPETFTAFFATPADETKDFKRPGGFSGKSVSPFYLVKRLTERFGLCGKGWKVHHYDTKFVSAPNGTTAVYVLLSLLYKEQGDTEWNEVGPHYGGDVIMDLKKPERQTKNMDGTFNTLDVDDEACKKAYTDAFSKCCSWLGLAGDIHDGMADGDKYRASKPWDVSIEESQATTRKAREVPQPPPPAEVSNYVRGWTTELEGLYFTLLDTTLYMLFKDAGHVDKFQAESELWKARKNNGPDNAETVIEGLEQRIAKLREAANKKKEAK